MCVKVRLFGIRLWLVVIFCVLSLVLYCCSYLLSVVFCGVNGLWFFVSVRICMFERLIGFGVFSIIIEWMRIVFLKVFG